MDEASASPAAKSIFISAGEQSGEMHGSGLVHELRELCGNSIAMKGLGGDMMKSEGVKLLFHINELAAVGLLEVAKKYTYFKKVLHDCLAEIKKNPPNAIVLIDYPGFNLKFASELRKFYEGKIVYYISPQIWAWHEKRALKIKKFIDKMLVVFPFEVDFYRRFDIDAVFVGHPLVKRIKQFLDATLKEKRDSNTKVLSIFAGSRNNEIKNHLPVLLKAAKIAAKEIPLRVKISKAISVDESAFAPYRSEMEGFELCESNAYEIMLNSDAAMVKCGTSTLECGLIGTPHFSFLRTAPINYMLLKPIVKIEKIDLINILLKNSVINEFIQHDFKPGVLADEIKKILTDVSYRKKQTDEVKKIWELLGDKDASSNSAMIISNLAFNK